MKPQTFCLVLLAFSGEAFANKVMPKFLGRIAGPGSGNDLDSPEYTDGSRSLGALLPGVEKEDTSSSNEGSASTLSVRRDASASGSDENSENSSVVEQTGRALVKEYEDTMKEHEQTVILQNGQPQAANMGQGFAAGLLPAAPAGSWDQTSNFVGRTQIGYPSYTGPIGAQTGFIAGNNAGIYPRYPFMPMGTGYRGGVDNEEVFKQEEIYHRDSPSPMILPGYPTSQIGGLGMGGLGYGQPGGFGGMGDFGGTASTSNLALINQIPLMNQMAMMNQGQVI